MVSAAHSQHRPPLLPPTLRPMLAHAAEGPLSSAEHAYELKWDGMRALVAVEGQHPSLRTRNGIEAADRFPELAAVRDYLDASTAVLDGEIVRLVNGRPDFGALQRRIHLSCPRDIRQAAAAEPVALILFDLLRVEDRWLLDEPWEARRAELEQVITGSGPAVQLSAVWADGKPLWDAVHTLGLEGIMAKRRGSRYLSGVRAPDWLKIKVHDTLDVVVGGWTEGAGARSGSLGALITGGFDGGDFDYLGHVGTGFDGDSLPRIAALLGSIETRECPFRPVPETNARPHWVRPQCVCEVRHQGWSKDGRMRAPVFVRWRPDKSPAECRVPQARPRG